MPWPSAAVAIATPSSYVISCNRWFPYVRLGEANTLAPLPSPEEPPAASCAVVFLRSPVSLTDTRVPLSVVAAEEAASLGRAE